MNDGGGADVRRRQNQQHDKRAPAENPPGADEFGRAVSKIAVAQLCESVGFQSFEGSALDSFSDVAVRYLRDLGKTTAFYANLAGRVECNVFDVIRGLEDLSSSQGFVGGSAVDHCLVESRTVRELIEYAEVAEEVPFAQPVPPFPVIRERRRVPSFMQMGETPSGKHIPAWLPAFPDQHTYIHTPMWNDRAAEDPRADKMEQARQRRKAERSLLSLQQRLLCNASVVDQLRADESDTFVSSPLQTEEREKDVSPVVCPVKLSTEAVVENHVSVLEAFAPAVEAVKGGVSDLGDSEKKAFPVERPAVHLKFKKTGKKLFRESLGLSLWNKGFGKQASWIGRDEERDDKKRRAELILRQSMENPQELTQL